jgi:tetratricopeptide (TPR) repeat protein
MNSSLHANGDQVGGEKREAKRDGEFVFQAALFLISSVVAAILRIAYLLPLRGMPLFDLPHRDSIAYVDRAREILSGDLLGSGVSFHSAPIYPFFMAAIMGPGGIEGLWLVRVVQALLSALTVGFLGLAALRLFGRAAAVATAVLAAFYAPFIFYSGELLEITLSLFFLSIFAWILASRRQDTPAIIAGGLCLGLASLGKPNLLLLAPMVLIAQGFLRPILSPRRWPWREGILFAAATLIVILPFTLRNKLAGDDWVLISSNGGINLFIGNNPNATGGFAVPSSFQVNLETSSREFAGSMKGESVKPSEASRFWSGRAMKFFMLSPGKALQNFALKAGLLVGHYEIPNHFNIYFFRDNFAAILRWPLVWFYLALPLAFVGLWAAARRNPQTKLAAWSALIVGASVVLFFVTSRYRIPMLIWLLPFAGMGAIDIWRSARQLNWRRLGVSLLAIGVAVILLSLPLIPKQDFNQSWVTLGSYWATKGDWDKAALYNQQALRANMDAAPAWQNLGYAYFQLARTDADLDRAEECLWRALSLDPFMGHAYGNLAALYYRLDRTLLIEPCVERAVALDPSLRSRLADIINFMGPKRNSWQNRVDGVRKRVNQNLAEHPESATFKVDKAFLLAMRLEEYDEAIEILKTLPPDSMRVDEMLGERVLRLTERIDRAKRYTPILDQPLPSTSGGFSQSSR